MSNVLIHLNIPKNKTKYILSKNGITVTNELKTIHFINNLSQKNHFF